MNSTFNDKQANREAGRVARHALRAALACVLVLGAGGTAFAQQHGDRDYGGAAPERHAERFRLPQMERDPRQADVPMRAYDDQRRAQQQAPQPYQPPPYVQQPQYPQQYQEPHPRPSGRMTADERAEMRRQVNEAKDFYPQRR